MLVANKYPVTDQDKEKLQNIFTSHPPKDGQSERYDAIRQMGFELAMTIKELTPFSREQSVAITRLEESIMWANKAIANNE